MAAIPLFRATNMGAVTSRENTLCSKGFTNGWDTASCVSPEVKPCWQGFNWVGDHVGPPHAVCPLGSEAGLAVINRASHILCRHCI